VGIESTTTSL